MELSDWLVLSHDTLKDGCAHMSYDGDGIARQNVPQMGNESFEKVPNRLNSSSSRGEKR